MVLISKISLPFQKYGPSDWWLCSLSWRLLPALLSCDWHVLFMQCNLWLSQTAMETSLPKELWGGGGRAGRRDRNLGIALWSWYLFDFLFGPQGIFTVSLHFDSSLLLLNVRVSWMEMALTILLMAQGVAIFMGTTWGQLWSPGHRLYSSQTLTLQMAFTKSVGYASTYANSISWRYTKWPLQMPFAIVPGSWLASF